MDAKSEFPNTNIYFSLIPIHLSEFLPSTPRRTCYSLLRENLCAHPRFRIRPRRRCPAIPCHTCQPPAMRLPISGHPRNRYKPKPLRPTW
jgi:hypothetical protein